MADPLSRAAIVTATRELILSDGLDAVSLRRVGARLEVTAPALYAYVSDKNDLLGAIADQEFARLIDAFDEVDEPDPLERSRRYSRVYVDHARHYPELFKTMFLFQPALGVGGPQEHTSDAATRAFEKPLRAIEEAVDAGHYAGRDAITVSLSIWVTVHGLAEMLLMGFELDDAFVDHVITTSIDAIIRGLDS